MGLTTSPTTRGLRFLLDLALCYQVFIALNIGMLAQCEVEPWTREDGRRWWETRMEAETAVTFSD